jgi:hypothetical protein
MYRTTNFNNSNLPAVFKVSLLACRSYVAGLIDGHSIVSKTLSKEIKSIVIIRN